MTTITEKRVEEWTLRDVEEILDGIRYVYHLRPKEPRRWCADRLIKKYRDSNLLVLQQEYVVWRDEHRQWLDAVRLDMKMKMDISKLRCCKYTTNGVNARLWMWDGKHKTYSSFRR